MTPVLRVLFVLFLSTPAVAVARGGPPDANADGKSDVENILGIIAYLDRTGVVYDDQDGGGHVPVRRADGKFHMVCVDLLTVCFRNAGYPFGGDEGAAGAVLPRVKSSHYRQVRNMRARIARDPRFRYYPGPNANPLIGAWRPAAPFRVGDMLFVDYEDAPDYHAGIVTGVDARTGLPTHVTQISTYSPNGGLHRSTFKEFFWLKCRRLTGWARPAAWEGTSPSSWELARTRIPTPAEEASPRMLPTAGAGGTGLAATGRLAAALEKLRASRRGVLLETPLAAPDEAPAWGHGRRHVTHFFR